MGKHKTQRTEEPRQAARRYIIAEQAQNHIEQHNFDRLVAQGVVVDVGFDKNGWGASDNALPPKVAGRA